MSRSFLEDVKAIADDQARAASILNDGMPKKKKKKKRAQKIKVEVTVNGGEE